MASLTLDDGGFFSPVPTLFLDADGLINDFNIALQVLFDPEAVPYRLEPAAQWRRRIGGHAEGRFLPDPEELCPPCIEDPSSVDDRNRGVQRSESCGYQSARFGWTSLNRTVVSRLNAQTGCDGGTLFYWDITAIERESAFRAKINWEQQKQQIWESYAFSYDRVLPMLPFYTEVVERHVAAMARPDVEAVLDMGAGTGPVTVALLERGSKISALDLNRAMLNKLRAKLAHRESGNVTIIEQNAEHLPQFGDGTMDGVSVLLAFYDMADPHSALAEALRVLRPGGTIVVTEPKNTFSLSPLLEFAERHMRAEGLYEELEPHWDRVMNANLALDPVARKSALRAELLFKTLREAGFQDLEMEDSHLGNCATVSGRKGQ